MRRTVPVLGAIIGLALAAGCTTSAHRVDGAAAPVGGRTAQSAPTGAASPTGAATPTGPATPSGRALPGGASPRRVAEALFRAPSGNIACYVDKDGARCDINQRSWTPPPKPASCTVDWAGGIFITGAGAAQFRCAGDAGLTISAKETLNYGQAVQSGDFMCSSERAETRCENTRSGHGFTLSVAKYSIF